MLDLERIAAVTPATEPFPYFVATDVLDPQSLRAIQADFPAISKPGLFTLDDVTRSGAFSDLVDEIQSQRVAMVIGKQFGLDLTELPQMVTVRGFCSGRDGRIHTDSRDKLVTCLLYLHDPDWDAQGGRLRLLRSGSDLNDVIAEVPPTGGTLIAFRRSNNSWHGHAPFEGLRRSIMFNWMQSAEVLSKNLTRHRISAFFKRFGLFDHY